MPDQALEEIARAPRVRASGSAPLGDEHKIAGALRSPELGTQRTSGAFKASVYAHRNILKIN
jgi:hypothetical protein